jgi:hypothetical protein
MNLTVQLAKGSFFDSERVLRGMAIARRKALSKAGAFVRTRARSSIRRRKTISQPGAPPSGHVGTYRQLIFFAYDKGSDSVVVGPTLFRPNSEVPQLLEHGGVTLRLGRNRKMHRAVYRARPAMQLALQAEVAAGTIPEAWRDTLR